MPRAWRKGWPNRHLMLRQTRRRRPHWPHGFGQCRHCSQEMLKVLGWRDGMQRRAVKDKPLSECQKRRNRKIASKRAKVEHVFAGIRHLGGKFIRTIGQARADVAMTLMAACYNIKRLAMFLGTGVDPFYKQARA